jgi:hypothetical protein
VVGYLVKNVMNLIQIVSVKERIIMKKYRYRVSALQKAIMSTFVEAENEQEAIEIAKKSEDWNFDNYLDEDYFDYEIDYSFDPERVKS